MRSQINTLLETAAEQMGIPYVKTTAERLQAWSIDGNNKTFIACLGANTSTNISFSQANSGSIDLTLVSVVETGNVNPEDNYTNDEVEYYKEQVEVNIQNFVRLIAKNVNVNSISYTTNEDDVFKDPKFLGIGLAFEISIDVTEEDESCDFFNNTQTK
jgi:hypothetical protein